MILVPPLHMCVSCNDHRHTAISEWQHCVRNPGLKPYRRLKTPPYGRLKILLHKPPSPQAVKAPNLLSKPFHTQLLPGAGDVMVARTVGAEMHLVLWKGWSRIPLVVAAKWPAGFHGEEAALWVSPPPQACVCDGLYITCRRGPRGSAGAGGGVWSLWSLT